VKDRRFYTEANREAWNRAVRVMRPQRGESLERDLARPDFSALDRELAAQLAAIGLAGKAVAHFCCHNGIELISILRQGAARGVGFDIADEAVAEARKLAALAGVAAEFERTDVYDIAATHDGRFDLVLFTIGGLCWLPDLPGVFRIAARLLRPGGDLGSSDLHPFTMMLPVPGEEAFHDPYRVEYSYFTGEPAVSCDGIDYVGHTKYDSTAKYDFPQKLSDVVNALLGAGFSLLSLTEYPHDIANLFGHLEKDGKVPLCYLLRARRAGIDRGI